jgi:7-cyano-7-deazaguanine synthase in queuosine biosynthesis
MKTLLLLSGGKDSRLAGMLLQEEHKLVALCMAGPQHTEAVGASKTASDLGIELFVARRWWFNETTWNPILLFIRNIGMFFIAVRVAHENRCQAVATGVSTWDLEVKHPYWLPFAMWTFKWGLRFFNLKLLSPLIYKP